MSTESLGKDTRAQPGASESTINNHENKDTSISCGAAGRYTPTPTSSTSSTLYKHNINITYKERVCVYLSAWHWDLFRDQAAKLGYSASELLNYFIISITEDGRVIEAAKAPPTFNVAIAKAESSPVINVGDFIAEKQLDTILSKVRSLKAKADQEKAKDVPLSFTVSRSKELEEDILRALKGAKRISPAKLEEVNAALTILRSIRGGA